MRENIGLFKAKDIGTREWREGSLGIVGFPPNRRYYVQTIPNKPFKYSELYEVDPETICECTGLCDKHGNKIWEGDVVEFMTNITELKDNYKDAIEKIGAMGFKYYQRKDQAIVQWNSKYGMWDLKVYNNGKYKRKSKLFTFRDSGYEVTGNRFEEEKV